MSEYVFDNKWALLDTNIFIEMAEGKQRANTYKPVFEFLKEKKCEIILLDSTYFELMSFSGNKKDYDFLYSWINNFPILLSRKEDIERASLISSYYKNSDNKLNKQQISYCDCLLAALTIKYKGRVFVVTKDIHDYPVTIFDLSKIMIIEDTKKAVVVGFVTYNEEKLLRAKDNFDRSAVQKN